jgi:outer membrane immunogenic protein
LGKFERQPDDCGGPASGALRLQHDRPVLPAFIGADYQFNWFVVGVEGDGQWSNLTGNSQATSSFNLPAGVLPGGPFTIDATIKDYGSIRGRAGVAFDRFLVFGTAGLAWGNPSNAYARAGSAPFFTNGGYSYGWTAGADYAITDSVFARLEYRHTKRQKPGGWGRYRKQNPDQ